jgi:hypothetical protein
MFSNITDTGIQWPGMAVVRKIGQVGLVGCPHVWNNGRSSRKLILRIPAPTTCVHLAVYSATFRVSKAHWFKIKVRLNWEMCQTELDTSEYILVV